MNDDLILRRALLGALTFHAAIAALAGTASLAVSRGAPEDRAVRIVMQEADPMEIAPAAANIAAEINVVSTPQPTATRAWAEAVAVAETEAEVEAKDEAPAVEVADLAVAVGPNASDPGAATHLAPVPAENTPSVGTGPPDAGPAPDLIHPYQSLVGARLRRLVEARYRARGGSVAATVTLRVATSANGSMRIESINSPDPILEDLIREVAASGRWPTPPRALGSEVVLPYLIRFRVD